MRASLWSCLALIPCVLCPIASAAPGSAARKPPARPAAGIPGGVRSLTVAPASVTLSGRDDRQLLAVTGRTADGATLDLSGRARYVSSQPRVATVSTAGRVEPAADGAAVVLVSVGKLAARVRVVVAGTRAPAATSFTRDIVPLLTQAGCNALACHGSPPGRAGFKLSMFGSDPALDYQAIVRQERSQPGGGRRVDPTAPEKSLVLAKPTMAGTPHGGGLRFRADSAPAMTMLAWLRAGAPDDSADLPAVSSLELFPSERVLAAPAASLPAGAGSQRLLVTAHFSDGSSADVTHRAIFETNDAAVVRAEEDEARAAGVGETVVFARYLGRIGSGAFLVPQPGRPAAAEYAAFKPANRIDELALRKWKKMGFVPSSTCSDTEFLRRVSLDLTGTLPTPESVRAFLADRRPDRRARKIDELIGGPAFVDWWTLYWGDSLRNNGRLIQPDGAKAYYEWIHKAVAENRPYDQFVRELVCASGHSFENGAVNFYRVARTPPERAEQVAQLFLGVRLQCANCHNHPFEQWTRTNYHQFAAFFARATTKNLPKNEVELAEQPNGEYRHPETNKPVYPVVLQGSDRSWTMPEAVERRAALADWIAAPANPLFARNIVNRLWGQLFGRGIVEPVDDVRATNPAVNEPLLDWLSRDLAAHGFDLRHTLRTIANSRTYQLGTLASPRNRRDTQNFSRAVYRRLKAEALLDAVCQATAQPERFNGYPEGTRAIQLMDNRVQSYFMDVFGRPRREVVCTCEREESANLTQALHFINGNTLNGKIGARGGRIEMLAGSGQAESAVVDELYLWTLSRPPTAAETQRAARLLAGASAKRPALEDLLWALLNSREFQYNH